MANGVSHKKLGVSHKKLGVSHKKLGVSHKKLGVSHKKLGVSHKKLYDKDRKIMKEPLHVFSVCGTYLKPEMQSIYRQIANLKKFRTTILAEKTENLGMFPIPPNAHLRKMYKFPHPRARGNFLVRFLFKHILKKWPPPKPLDPDTRLQAELKVFLPYNLHLLCDVLRPDLVHVYYGHKAVKYHGMLKKWMASGGSWIVSFHGVDVVKFMDEPGYKDKMQVMLKDANLVLARSKSLLKEVEKLGCPPEKLRLNHTPIPMQNLKSVVVKAPKDEKWQLIQACRLVKKKGILTMLKALKIIIIKFPKVNYTIVGEGPEKTTIQNKIKELGLAKNVSLLGWLKNEELFELLPKCHVFVHPSEKTKESDQEGIPNSLIEAMAVGLPVVATNHGGIPEAVENDIDGILVGEKDSSALANAVMKICSTPKLLQKFSKNASKNARQKFELSKQVENLEKIYLEAIKH